MCLEDIKINRAMRTRLHFADPDVNGSNNIRPDQNRVACRLLVATGGVVTLSAASPPVVTGTMTGDFPLAVALNDFAGASLNVNWLVQDVTLADVGDILRGPLVFSASHGFGFMIEVYLEIETNASMNVAKLPKGDGY